MGIDNNNDSTCSPEKLALVQRLFITHTRELLGYLIVFAPDSNSVDDLLHEVFLRITAKAAAFQEGTNFLAWARAIARNLVYEAARGQHDSPWALSPEVMEKLEENSPDLAVTDERLSLLGECIETLNSRQREVIQLRYEGELAPDAIARRTSLQAESVHVVLSRARAALRDCVERKQRLMERT